jgi:two-component system, cell cycle sensor histidine kinase and response regulator CckA
MRNGAETILVAEDELLVRTMIATALRARGYNVLEGANGAEALQVAQEYGAGKIQLLLSDITMPLMDGIALARQFRNMSPDVKILLMSGYTHEPELVEAIPDPGIGFLPKPFSIQELAEKVREVLDQ